MSIRLLTIKISQWARENAATPRGRFGHLIETKYTLTVSIRGTLYKLVWKETSAVLATRKFNIWVVKISRIPTTGPFHYEHAFRLRVVPLSLSPSCVTRRKTLREEKWPRELLRELRAAIFLLPQFSFASRTRANGLSESGTIRSLAHASVMATASGRNHDQLFSRWWHFCRLSNTVGVGIFRFWRNSLFSKRSLQPLYFSPSPSPTQSSLPFWAGAQFSRDSLRAFNDRTKIHKQWPLFGAKMCEDICPQTLFVNRS